MNHAGFDTDQFPGLETMAWLKANTNLVWSGFYLGPAPSHNDTGWMGQREALVDAGWGLAPIFVGQELAGPGSHLVNADQGRTDGIRASALMQMAGFERGSVCFLDLEDGAPWAEPRISYVTAWALALQGQTVNGVPNGFHTGIYCSHGIAEAVHLTLLQAGVEAPDMWVFKVATTDRHAVAAPFSEADPSGSGYSAAYFWQHDQNAMITVEGGHLLEVDLSTSVFTNPAGP